MMTFLLLLLIIAGMIGGWAAVRNLAAALVILALGGFMIAVLMAL